MKTFSHLWQKLAEFSVKWKTFQVKVVEKLKAHILCSITFFRKSYRSEIMLSYGKTRKATDDYVTWRMRYACCINKAKHTFSKLVIIIASSRQQWLRKRASKLWYTYIACLVWVITFGVRNCLVLVTNYHKKECVVVCRRGFPLSFC
jgi:hypothetical protein